MLKSSKQDKRKEFLLTYCGSIGGPGITCNYQVQEAKQVNPEQGTASALEYHPVIRSLTLQTSSPNQELGLKFMAWSLVLLGSSEG